MNQRQRTKQRRDDYEARAKRRQLLRDSGVEYLTDDELQLIIDHDGMKGIFNELKGYWVLLQKVNHGCTDASCPICDEGKP